MSVNRQANFLNQQRVDVPHLRALESSIAADFDALAGQTITSRPLVVAGLVLVTQNAVGNPATSLQLLTAGAGILHPTATEHGTVFTFADTLDPETLNAVNPRVSGGFSPSAVNYVGLDLLRFADSATTDNVAFLDANTKLEVSKSVPLARTPQYRIVIGTRDFESQPNLLPIAKVTTNGSNIVTTIEDVRPMLGRLAKGGSAPDVFGSYAWPQGRSEALTLVGSDYTSQTFAGGDKAFSCMKDWMDGVMTRLWEVGGGAFWYSPTSDRELKLVCSSDVLVSGDNFSWVGGVLKWKGISISFGNSSVYVNDISDNDTTGVALTAGQCLYVDLDRNSNLTALTAQVGDLMTLGQSPVPGQRFVIAWCVGSDVLIKDRPYEVGREYLKATDVAYGVVRLKYAAPNPADPTVLAMSANGSFTNTGTGSGPGFSGTGGSTIGAQGIVGTGGSAGGIGGYFTGINGYAGSFASGGTSTTADGGTGISAIGGATTHAGFHGGYGALLTGANHANGGAGGHGAYATGGTSSTGSGAGGDGGHFVGGASAGGTAGHGVYGAAGGANSYGGYFVNTFSGSALYATASGTGRAANLFATGSGTCASVDASGGTGLGLYVHGNSSTAAVVIDGDAAQEVLELNGGGSGAPSLLIASFANTLPALWVTTAGTKDKVIAKFFGYVDLTGAVNPGTSTGFTNVITPKNVSKAWVRFHTDGAGGVVVDDGFNISGVTIFSSDSIDIGFTNAMSGTNYAPVPSTNGNAVLSISNSSASSCRLTVVSTYSGAGNWSDPAGGYLTAGVRYFSVIVMGAQ